MIKKTSIEWSRTPPYNTITILDPDGWDRLNFDFSFNEELISEQEFVDRLHRSTCINDESLH